MTADLPSQSPSLGGTLPTPRPGGGVTTLGILGLLLVVSSLFTPDAKYRGIDVLIFGCAIGGGAANAWRRRRRAARAAWRDVFKGGLAMAVAAPTLIALVTSPAGSDPLVYAGEVFGYSLAAGALVALGVAVVAGHSVLRGRGERSTPAKSAPSALMASSQRPLPSTHIPQTAANDEEEQRDRFWRAACAAPPPKTFVAMLERLHEPERRAVSAKAAAVREIIQNVLEHRGLERTECERRRYAVLLDASYPSELRGDFSASDEKTRETVITLLASGLAAERLLLNAGADALLSTTFPTDERSPVAEERANAQQLVRTAQALLSGTIIPNGGSGVPANRDPDVRVERECPYCAERILAKARVCKHCGRDVPPLFG